MKQKEFSVFFRANDAVLETKFIVGYFDFSMSGNSRDANSWRNSRLASYQNTTRWLSFSKRRFRAEAIWVFMK